MVATSTSEVGLEPLHILKSTDPPLWLAPNTSLSQATRHASQCLFSMLKPFNPKSPFDHLLVDGFDAEQIWQQIDLQSQPILSKIRRDLKWFEKNPEILSSLKVDVEDKKKLMQVMVEGLIKEGNDFDEGLEEFDEDEEEEEDDGEGGDNNDDENDENIDEVEDEDDDNIEEGEEGEEEESNGEDEGKGGGGGIEDGFLKIKELEEFMDEDEGREYDLQKNKDIKKKQLKGSEEEETDDDENEEDNELEDLDLGDDEEDGKQGKARYEDFFGAKRKKQTKRKSKSTKGSEDSDLSDEEEDIEALEEQKSENLSTHQRQLMKLQSEIDQMEKANLEPKTWTMQGEVTATKRPKNSALEVDLDFDHNVRPPPVITEEVTATLEEMIQKRILEGRFDDVQKLPKRPTLAPREIKELDENKSKKGLGEIYEQEYVEKTNLNAAPSSFSDETKKEASILFKKLCLKLDALSHFHFAPKPVIEDMSIQSNVPALAMEEIAPVAVSDAAMLAPEEVFAGKGNIKEAAELTQPERKRKRANKKRRYKAMVAKRDAKKPRNTKILTPNEGQEGMK